jgi:hypothetical protein
MDINKVSVGTNLMASTAVNGLRNTGSKGENKVESESKLEDKLESKITKDGILLKFKDKEKLVKIEGDVNNIKEYLEGGDGGFGLGILFGVFSSALEGALKGLGVTFLGSLYPLVPAISKYIDSYKEVKEEAKEMVNDGNECGVSNAALKGGILGAAKALGHGILDLAVIGSLTALGVSFLGPIGFALSPFIGSIYNVAKDDIRLKLEGTKSSGVSVNGENNETKESNKEENPREPFFPFPPKK